MNIPCPMKDGDNLQRNGLAVNHQIRANGPEANIFGGQIRARMAAAGPFNQVLKSSKQFVHDTGCGVWIIQRYKFPNTL